MSKGRSGLILFLISLIVISAGYISKDLDFDYDFENFFPQNDPDLEYFLKFREQFQNDNDFVLISLGDSTSVFNQDFLNKIDHFTNEARKLNHVTEVVSPTQIKTPIMNSFGFIEVPLLHINNPTKFKSDSIRISKSIEFNKTFFSSDYKSLCVIINHTELISKESADTLLSEIETLINKTNVKQVNYAGKIRGQKVYLTKMKFELILFLSISLILIISFLFISFRSFYGIIIPLITVFASIIGVLGIMQLTGKMLDVMSTLLPTILFVVGMSDAVHIYTRYIEELRNGAQKKDAIKTTFKEVGLATFFTSITTAVGFITLLMVPIKPMQEFGLYTAIGVVLAFGIAITLLPASLSLVKKPKIASVSIGKVIWNKILSRCFIFLLRNPRKIVISYFIILVGAIVGISRLEIDYKLLEDLSEKDPLQIDFRYFEDKYSGIRPFEMAIYTKDSTSILDYEVLKEMDKVEKYLYENYEVGFIISPVSFIKSINKATNSGNSTHYKLPDSQKKYNLLLKKMKRTNIKSKMNLFYNDSTNTARFTGKMDDIGSKKTYNKNEAFKKFFLSEVNTDLIDYKMTGTALLVDKNNESLATNMITGLIIAFLLIALLITIIFRSVKMGLLSIIPNVLPIAIIAGLMGFLGTNLNMSTSIIFTIAFGIAVDDTIHFLSKFKIEQDKGRSLIYSLKRTYLSTGKAIIVTTLILCGGFISLVFSDFKSTFLIGSYVGLILFLAVITDLMLLPIILILQKRKL